MNRAILSSIALLLFVCTGVAVFSWSAHSEGTGRTHLQDRAPDIRRDRTVTPPPASTANAKREHPIEPSSLPPNEARVASAINHLDARLRDGLREDLCEEVIALEALFRSSPEVVNDVRALCASARVSDLCKGLVLLLLARSGHLDDGLALFSSRFSDANEYSLFAAIARCVAGGAARVEPRAFWTACVGSSTGLSAALGQLEDYNTDNDVPQVLEEVMSPVQPYRGPSFSEVLVQGATSSDADTLIGLAQSISDSAQQSYLLNLVGELVKREPAKKHVLWSTFRGLSASGQGTVIDALERSFCSDDASRLAEAAAWGNTVEVRLRAVSVLARCSLTSLEAKTALIALRDVDGGDIQVKRAAATALNRLPR